jgi:hypothetical protein
MSVLYRPKYLYIISTRPMTPISSFNRQVRLLTKDLVSRLPSTDAVAGRALKRIIIATTEAPQLVIETVGPVLLRYKDQLYGKNKEEVDKFFLTQSYDDEFKDSVDEVKIKMVKELIPKAKEVARAATPAVRDSIREQVTRLLDYYIDYLAAQRGLSAV